jgi:hypothetical protein
MLREQTGEEVAHFLFAGLVVLELRASEAVDLVAAQAKVSVCCDHRRVARRICTVPIRIVVLTIDLDDDARCSTVSRTTRIGSS